MEEVFVMFSEPLESIGLVSEKLRMSVGLKLNDDISLNLLFLKNSLPFLGKLEGENADTALIEKSLDMIIKLGTTIYAEKDNEADFVMHDFIKPSFFDPNEFKFIVNNAKRIIS